MRYLTLGEILELYRQIVAHSGGLASIRDLGALEAALSQPQMTFENEELYPTLIEKASALGFSLIKITPS
jgi:death on curing protein